jgi:hypothetical protein
MYLAIGEALNCIISTNSEPIAFYHTEVLRYVKAGTYSEVWLIIT